MSVGMPVLRRVRFLAALLLLLLGLLPVGSAAAGVRATSAPALSASPSTGPAGTTTTLSGTGFRARTKVVRATSAPALSASPSTGPAGTTTTLSGTGFRARTKGFVTVGNASYGVATNRKGAFAIGVTVPTVTPEGALALTARISTASATTRFLVTAPEVPEPVDEPRLRFGVSTPGGLSAKAELDAVTTLAGEAPTVVLAFSDFSRELDVAGLESVTARGAVPLVTWEPWVAGGGVTQPEYALDRITAGDFDPYLRRWADGLRTFGRPVMLRFAHEMNGDWYPWAEGVNGNEAGDYAAAWRHVHHVVTAAGASNVSWVWSPNVPYPGSVPLAGLYPGAASVDVVALDGYNFGTSQSWSSWVVPEQLFGAGLQQLRTLAPGLPVIIAETASSELGGVKADWARSLFAYLATQSDVTAVVWFHHLKETDWRIDSSPGSATAVREALAARRTAV